ncbi:hypothetical protein [Cryobacterium sp. SO1]|uniref:hypothetical protein n=1 Tax=Cryobacterium sp. SO1 TaxID=1897061 RepID=UPI001023CCD1|nr:hypothetical protein [Cryobacterium sp. SO1]RZI36984.1 hypothetical protein BJQ95_00651 [Cryobacterium sp. SO1]
MTLNVTETAPTLAPTQTALADLRIAVRALVAPRPPLASLIEQVAEAGGHSLGGGSGSGGEKRGRIPISPGATELYARIERSARGALAQLQAQPRPYTKRITEALAASLPSATDQRKINPAAALVYWLDWMTTQANTARVTSDDLRVMTGSLQELIDAADGLLLVTRKVELKVTCPTCQARKSDGGSYVLSALIVDDRMERITCSACAGSWAGLDAWSRMARQAGIILPLDLSMVLLTASM